MVSALASYSGQPSNASHLFVDLPSSLYSPPPPFTSFRSSGAFLPLLLSSSLPLSPFSVESSDPLEGLAPHWRSPWPYSRCRRRRRHRDNQIWMRSNSEAPRRALLRARGRVPSTRESNRFPRLVEVGPRHLLHCATPTSKVSHQDNAALSAPCVRTLLRN